MKKLISTVLILMPFSGIASSTFPISMFNNLGVGPSAGSIGVTTTSVLFSTSDQFSYAFFDDGDCQGTGNVYFLENAQTPPENFTMTAGTTYSIRAAGLYALAQSAKRFTTGNPTAEPTDVQSFDTTLPQGNCGSKLSPANACYTVDCSSGTTCTGTETNTFNCSG